MRTYKMEGIVGLSTEYALVGLLRCTDWSDDEIEQLIQMKVGEELSFPADPDDPRSKTFKVKRVE